MKTLAMFLLNASVQAGWLALALIAVRLVFRKAPKKLLCALWALVGLRLAVPVSLRSVFSLLPSAAPVAASSDVGGVYVQTGLPPVDNTVNTILQIAAAPTAPTRELAEQTALDWKAVLAVVWICGVVVMLLYAAISFLRLRLQVREAVKEDGNVYICDRVGTPFILGVVRPRIYLPSSLDAGDRAMILLHERAHLKRRDHLWKPLGFLLLSVYWFHPVLWVVYVLLCRDIELACDERVLRQQGSDIKKDYASALLRCSAPRHLVRACPVAFGEVGVKARIKSVLNYKKPAFWVILLALIASAVVAVCFMTIPKERAPAVVTVLNTGSNSEAVTVQPESVSLDRQTLRLEVTYVNTGDQPIEAHETVWMLREADGAYEPLEVRNNDWDTTLRFRLPAQEQQTYNYTPSAFCDCTAPGAYRFQVHFRFADEPENSYPHLLWFDFKITSPEEPNALVPLPDGMDDAIHEAILKDNADGYWGGECAMEGHVVYGCEQNGSTWKVYLYHGFERYGFINGYFTDVSGHWSVAVLTMELRDAGFICKQIDYPRDGSENAPSIKRLFPKKLEHRALNPTQSDRDEVTRQCEAQAKAYLKTISRGRDVRIVPYNQLDLQLPNLTAEVSNKLSNELGRMEGLYELTLGTREQLENGVRYVYRTSLLDSQHELLFTKERYDTQEVVERFLADTQTGEWLTDSAQRLTKLDAGVVYFDAQVSELRDGGTAVVTVTVAPKETGLQPGTQVVLQLKGTEWENMPLYDGNNLRVLYKDGSLMETYPLQLRDIVSIEPLDAVALYLDGTVTKISGKWATVTPLQTQTQRDMPATVRVSVTPVNQAESLTPAEGDHYRILYYLKDVTSDDPMTIDPPQAFYALGDINSQGNVAAVVPTTGAPEPTTRLTTDSFTTYDASKGLTVYVWKLSEENTKYSLLPGAPESHTFEQTIEMPGVSLERMREILQGYHIAPEKVYVKPFQIPISSYLWKFDSGEAQRQRDLLGLTLPQSVQSTTRTSEPFVPTTTKTTEPTATTKPTEPTWTTRAYTPEEQRAIQVLGEEAVERFPDLKNTTNAYLEKAYVLMNCYPKFKKANVKSYDVGQDSDGYQDVTLHTDKGDFKVKYDGFGCCVTNNQETRETMGIAYYFPDISKRENVQMLSLYYAFHYMMRDYPKFQGAFVKSFDQLVEEDKTTVTLHTDKGDCTVVMGPTGKYISTRA